MSIKFDKNFKQQVLAVEKEMIEDAKKLTAFVLVTFHSFVVADSAKATGRYKGAHVFEAGSRTDWTPPEGLSESQYEQLAKKETDRISKFRFDFITRTYYIANNLSYASILEAGRKGNKGSLQMPNGNYGPASIKTENEAKKKFASFNNKRYK